MTASSGFRIIKAVAPADVADVAALFAEYGASLVIDLSTEGFAEEITALPGAYSPPGGTLLLARDRAERPLGCVALRTHSPRVGEVKRLYVRPKARGLGLGRVLMEEVCAEARGLGHGEVKLDTLASLTAAAGLYTAMGFSPIPAYGAAPWPDMRFFAKTL